MSTAVLSLLLSLIVTSFCQEGPLASQSSENDSLRSPSMSERLRSLQSTVQSLVTQVQVLASQLAEAKGQLQTLQARRKVSFFVQLSQYRHQLTSENVPLVFDNVIFNVGDGYQRSTGRFVAPVAGTYVFLLNVLQPADSPWTNIVINKNQDEVALTQLQHMGSSLSLVLELQAGDYVWVMKSDGPSRQIYGIDHTTFSGALLH